MTLRLAAAALVLVLAPRSATAQDAPAAPPAGAGMYYWYDEAGSLHVTDQIEEVPAAHREEALGREKRGESGPEGHVSVVEVEGSGTVEAPAQPAQEAAPAAVIDVVQIREYWQTRLSDQRARKSAAEAEARRLEAEIGRVNSLRPAGFHEKLITLDRQHQEQLQIAADAQHQLDVEIPEEARRLGIPPGWLR